MFQKVLMKVRLDPIFSLNLDTKKCLKSQLSSLVSDLCYRYLPKKMTYPYNHHNNHHNRINNPNRRRNPLQFEARTVQLNGTSLTLTIPSLYADILGIHAGDIIKITCQKDDRKLVAQR